MTRCPDCERQIDRLDDHIPGCAYANYGALEIDELRSEWARDAQYDAYVDRQYEQEAF